MGRLLECVPNFSEGRRPEVIDAIAGGVERVRGVSCLDRTMDAVHNRAVLTLAGEPEALETAVLAAAGIARNLIDLNWHEGVHPRIGALDVCPFVPLMNTPMQVAVETAHRVASRLTGELQIPTYLYENAAEDEAHRDLADVRRLHDPKHAHPTAGATAVGARFFLIAWNVEIAAGDVAVARHIARAIRASSGGMPCVKALGFRLADASRCQVSMNLVDYRVTPVRSVFDRITELTGADGVAPVASELIGLVPRDAIDAATARHILLSGDPIESRWIETRLARLRESGR